MQTFLQRFQPVVAGVLQGFDRLRFRGSKRQLGYVSGMSSWLGAMHILLKDYKGWEFYSGYCPLGMGNVDIPAVLDMAEASGQNPDIMVELDPSPNGPMTPLETVKTTKAYLVKQGYTFKS